MVDCTGLTAALRNAVTLSGGRSWFAPGQVPSALARPPRTGEGFSDSAAAVLFTETVAATSYFPLLILLFPTAEHPGADQTHKSRDLSAKSLLLFPRDGCIHTGTVSRHFLILSSVK